MGGRVITSERWRQIEEILVASWEFDPELRDEFLRERCRNDSELLRELRRLDAADAATGQWTEPPSEPASSTQKLSHYELERLIGRGGMGAVYLAHRADGQFEQQVAIKIIGLPFELDEIRDRFRRERQILAGLQHPNITRLLDGGITEDGQLYLVMEYVDGVPINQFPADLDKKFDLFLSVCQAVQYAHQNLIVHRDLKPSNILVDRDGTAKLLDFGAAKLLDDSEATRTGFSMATVAYASPEQLRSEKVSTLSDVFSLGAILYELVGGEKAFGDDLVSRLGAGEAAEVKLPKQLPGDLDTVVRKALALAPSERYQSAEQLADDVRRYRNGEPVMAHPPSFRYRAGKFARRNKLAFGAGVLLLLTLLAGIGGVLWQYRKAIVEHRKAEARAEDLRKLSDSLLTQIDDAIQKLPGSTPAQKLLVSAVLEHLDRTVKDSAGDPQLEVDAANAYLRLGNVQGSPYHQNIGDTQGASASLDKALSIAIAVSRKYPENTSAKQALGLAHKSLGDLLFGIAQTQEAVVEMRSAIASFEELASIGGLTPDTKVDALLNAAGAYMHLGDEFGMVDWPSLGDFPSALAAYRTGGKIYERAAQIEPANPSVLQGIIEIHRRMGAIELHTDPAGAVSELQNAIKGTEALHEQAKQSVEFRRLEAGVLGPYAGALTEIGQYHQALAALEQGRAIQEALLAADPRDLRSIQDLDAGLSREAECYQERAAGIFAEEGSNRTADAANALRVLLKERSLLEDIVRIEPNDSVWPAKLGLVLIDIARQQQALQRPEGSLALAQKGLSMLKDVGRRQHTKAFQLDDVVTGLITVEPATLREPALAVTYAERTVEMSGRHNADFLLTLARAYRAAGQASNARAAAKEGLALLPPETEATVPSRVRKLLQAEIRGGTSK